MGICFPGPEIFPFTEINAMVSGSPAFSCSLYRYLRIVRAGRFIPVEGPASKMISILQYDCTVEQPNPNRP